MLLYKRPWDVSHLLQTNLLNALQTAEALTEAFWILLSNKNFSQATYTKMIFLSFEIR